MNYSDDINSIKKRKYEIDVVIRINKILEFDIISKKWLIEWDNKTRTWEFFEDIKNMYEFKKLLENLFIKTGKFQPSYII
jgi:hypothetical protein